MRFRRMLVAWSFAVVAGACAEGAEAKYSDGALVLEVGGQQASLREALRAAGVRMPRTGTEPEDRRDAEPRDNAAPARSVAPSDAPPSTPPVEEPWFVVSLADGQTLIHLARKHLGDGNRFRELLALNGWSEADSRRLRVGQQVKIPRQQDEAPRARR